ncbi:hypothetical protein WQE_27560 [Paraburkholderia hospita]|jgi:hypothetical protein|uniref:Translation initiation factor IF-2 n=1 Tax=Paraburkholderia hospita TaxID=169430 RepID=A0ABN0FGC1_9BURK|nr:hypothetical protein [Paraburkholderia hospita]EIM97751.1 hypothetical protein WQE_27560 [Paraburkholderia hospita]EUC17883.1 hypothetical protein PMI06_003918 [Burkholderia sp. BT03]OUL79227.1 hypothetical protein CA602_29735 [Paraburkholderia hospita]SKC89572.1 hypothetical protein SAMN06266956_4330 [Paraburkholderia hospita]
MKRLIPSFAPAAVALCAVAALSGCVAYPYGGQPAGYGYNDGYYDGYGAPVPAYGYGYAEPPVQSSLFLGFGGGGYSGSNYDRHYWGGRGYDHGNYNRGDRGNWNGNGRGGNGNNGGPPRGQPPQAGNPPAPNPGGNSGGGYHGNRQPVQAGSGQQQGGGNRGGQAWNNEGGRPH